MKHWTWLLILLASTALAKDPILVHEVTEETYDAFLAQYTESCRPHVKRWVGAAALAADRFNKGNYVEAHSVIQQYIMPGDARRRTGSAAIMFNEDCSTEDLVLTLAQSEALQPMINSSACMVRVMDGDRAWNRAAYAMEEAGRRPTNEELQVVLHHVNDAWYAMQDVLGDDPDKSICRHLGDEFLNKFVAQREAYAGMRDELEEIISESE